MEAKFELSTVKKKLLMGFRTPFNQIGVDGDLVEKIPNQDYDARLKLSNNGKQTELTGKVKVTVQKKNFEVLL